MTSHVPLPGGPSGRHRKHRASPFPRSGKGTATRPRAGRVAWLRNPPCDRTAQPCPEQPGDRARRAPPPRRRASRTGSILWRPAGTPARPVRRHGIRASRHHRHDRTTHHTVQGGPTMAQPVIVEAVRTPIGKRNGWLSGFHAAELLGNAQVELVKRAGIDPGDVEQIVGRLRHPGRRAGLQRHPHGVAEPGPALRDGGHHRRLPVRLGPAGQPLRGQPDQRRRHRRRHRLRRRGHEPGRSRRQRLQRPGQVAARRLPLGHARPVRGGRADRRRSTASPARTSTGWASSPSARRRVAVAEGRFDREIVPLEAPVVGPDGPDRRAARSSPRTRVPATPPREGLAGLKPVLPDGMHTAGNSSQISDGAAAVLWMSEDRAGEAGLRPRARIVAQTLVGSDPYYHLDGPIAATADVLTKAGMTMADIDIFEVNEAFASVVMSWGKVHERRLGQGQRQRRRHRPRPPGRLDRRPAHHHRPARARAVATRTWPSSPCAAAAPWPPAPSSSASDPPPDCAPAPRGAHGRTVVA